MKRNSIDMFLITICIGIVLTACTSEQLNDTPTPPSTIRIGYHSEEKFKARYSILINNDLKLADQTYTIIPTTEIIRGEKDVESWSKENEFDIIYLPGPVFEKFVDKDQLLKLDQIIKTPAMEAATFIPAAIEYAKLYGHDTLYGLPPGMDGRAIVYNQAIFEKYKIDLPVDHMSWDDLIQLAASFPSKGLSVITDSGFELIWDIGQTNHLKAYQNEPPKVSFNDEAWAQIWNKVREPLSSGNIILGEYFLRSFLEGESAMALVSNRQYTRLKEKKPNFKWGMVTMPVDPHQLDATKYMYADGIYAISASSPNQAAAIEWLSFFLSEKTLASDTRADYFGIKTRQRSKPDPFAEAVFKLTPKKREELPFDYLSLGEDTLQRLLSSSISVDSALDGLQAEAEGLLHQVK